MTTRRIHSLTVNVQDGFAIVSLSQEMQVWDGSDLAHIREAIAKLIEQDGHRAIRVDLNCVSYIPSGFFGMLYDLYQSGYEVQLYDPKPAIIKMRWFQMFFLNNSPEDGVYTLLETEVMAAHGPDERTKYHLKLFGNGDEDMVDDDKFGGFKILQYRKITNRPRFK